MAGTRPPPDAERQQLHRCRYGEHPLADGDHRRQAALSQLRTGGGAGGRERLPERPLARLPDLGPHHPGAEQLRPAHAVLQRHLGRHLQVGMDQQPGLGVLRHCHQRPFRPGKSDPAGLGGQVEAVRDRALLRSAGQRRHGRPGAPVHLQPVPADPDRRLQGATGHGQHVPGHQLLCRWPGHGLSGHAEGPGPDIQPGQRDRGPLPLRR